MRQCDGSCIYEECQIPESNARYGWYLAYIGVGLAVLFYSVEAFTFFQTFLFIAPVFLDLLNTKLHYSALNVVRTFLGVIDAVVLVGCVLGFAGIFIDKGASFATSESFLFLQGAEVPKTSMGIVLALNTMVPVIFGIGSPCKKLCTRVKHLNKQAAKRKVG